MSTATITAPVCPECQSPMHLRETRRFSYANGKPRKFWGCSRYPDCRVVHGAHPDGRPLGTPTNDAGKKARIAAHEEFDAMIKERNWGRTGAYIWLSRKMQLPEEQCHIGLFDEKQCARVIDIVQVARKRTRKTA
jgi:ssDNA-binding Zn-finger/Zn-ribbon topoisomerase 1